MMLHSPRTAPMFRVLRPRFAASSMRSCSTGFASPYKHIRDEFTGAAYAEMTLYKSEQTYFATHLLHGCARAHQALLPSYPALPLQSSGSDAQLLNRCLASTYKYYTYFATHLLHGCTRAHQALIPSYPALLLQSSGSDVQLLHNVLLNRCLTSTYKYFTKGLHSAHAAGFYGQTILSTRLQGFRFTLQTHQASLRCAVEACLSMARF